MGDDKRYGLVIIFNDAYVDGAWVFLKTFFKHNSWYKGDIICCYDEKYCLLSDENKKFLQSEFNNLYFRCVDSSLYENFINHFLNIISHKRFVVSAFTLEAFAIKYDREGNEYDRIVYLDVDQIVEGDVSLLFTTDKDIVAAPGDNVIFNVDGNTLLQRNRESVSGGLFSISPKYLGESVRNEIIKRGEEFIYKYVDNLPWSGIGFEMDVLNVWLLDKDTWITSSIYAYPSMFYKKTLVENASNIIKYELFRTSRIIHIWDEKPWTKSRENCDGKIDLYWWHIYDSLKNGKNPKPLKEFFHDEIDDKVSSLYQLYALNRNERNTWELLDGTLQK